MSHTTDDRDPDTDHCFPEPPVPTGMDPAHLYTVQMGTYNARRLEHTLRKLPTEAAQVARHAELRADIRGERAEVSGALGKAMDWIRTLPSAIQIALAILGLQWGGVLFAKLTGVQHPQLTVPTFVTGDATTGTATAADPLLTTPEL